MTDLDVRTEQYTIKLYMKSTGLTLRRHQRVMHLAWYDLKEAVVSTPELEVLAIVYNRAGKMVSYTVDGGEYDGTMTLDELISVFTNKEGSADE